MVVPIQLGPVEKHVSAFSSHFVEDEHDSHDENTLRRTTMSSFKSLLTSSDSMNAVLRRMKIGSLTKPASAPSWESYVKPVRIRKLGCSLLPEAIVVGKAQR